MSLSHMNHPPLRVAIASFLLCMSALRLPSHLAASCLPPPILPVAISTAAVAFVGTVRQVTNLDRTAVLDVEEIWKGPNLPDHVEVHGGPEQPDRMTSVDRTWQQGARYL